MPKPNKSSATSNTRKKQNAKKGADGKPMRQKTVKLDDPNMKGLTKAQRKALKENRPRVFVPPPRPPVPARPDPLDAQGLARTLPAELVVILRRLGKKDAITRRKGIDELKELWVDVVVTAQRPEGQATDDENSWKEDALTEALPVWLHHLPSLLLSPSHRTASLQLHTRLLKIPSIKSSLLNTLSLGLLPGQHHGRDVLGTWMTAALEEGRRGTVGSGEEVMSAWESFVDWDAEAQEDGLEAVQLNMSENLDLLLDYLRLAILEPQELYRQVHPPPVKASESPAPVITNKKGGKDKGLRGQSAKEYFTPTIETEVEESDIDIDSSNERSTRYQISGLLGLAYVLQHAAEEALEKENFTSLLTETQLWDLFTTPANAGDASQVAAPPVRQALYEVFFALASRFETFTRSKLLGSAGSSFLRNIWTEMDASVWAGRATVEAVVAFLTKYKEIWLYEEHPVEDTEAIRGAEAAAHSQDEDEDTDDDEEEEAQEAEDPEEISISSSETLGQTAYRNFLGYLQRACNGSPSAGYQLVLVVVSTLPEKLLSPDPDGLETLCNSLWAAHEARLLPSSTGFSQSAFYDLVSTILDCIVFLNIRNFKSRSAVDVSDTSSHPSVEEAVSAQIRRVWTEGVLVEASKLVRMNRMVGAERKTEFYRMALNVASAAARLDKVSLSTAQKTLVEVSQATIDAFTPNDDANSRAPSAILVPRLQLLLEALEQGYNNEGAIKATTDQISVSVTTRALHHILRSITSNSGVDKLALEDYPKMLALLLQKRGSQVMNDAECKQDLQNVLVSHIAQLLGAVEADLIAPVYIGYLKLLPRDTAQGVWQQLSLAVGGLAQPATYTHTRVLLAIGLDPELKVESGDTSWGEIAIQAGENALSEDSAKPEAVELVKFLFAVEGNVIGRESFDHLLTLLTTSLSHRSLTSDSLSMKDQSVLLSLLEMLGPAITKNPGHIMESDIHRDVFPQLFKLAFLFSTESIAEDLQQAALQIWRDSCSRLSAENLVLLNTTIRRHLLNLIIDVEAILSPYEILGNLFRQENSDVCLEIEMQIDPEELNMKELLQDKLRLGYGRASSWVLDSLLPYERNPSSQSSVSFDSSGRSNYGRAVEAIICTVHSDIASVKATPSVLLHITLASRLAADALDGMGSYGLYSDDIDRHYLKSICRESEQVMSYAISSLAADLPLSWHQSAMTSMTKDNARGDTLLGLLYDLATQSDAHEVYMRSLRDIIERILRSADMVIAERWLAFASGLNSKPDLALAIVTAANRNLERSPRLDRLRNEMASQLAGVKLQSASTEGLRILQLLNAITPSEQSEDIFLPQQRAIFLMQHLNGWLLSDDEGAEDIPEEIEARIALLYSALAPIVQDVAGSHWNSIYDMISSNLEVVTFADEDTYNLMYSTLSLLETVQKLAMTNKALRANWTEKAEQVKTAANLLLTVQPGLRRTSTSAILLDMTIGILDRSGDDIAFFDSMEKVYPMLGFADLPVQRSLYHILRKSIHARTASLVVEIEADALSTESETQAQLPLVLIDLAGQAREESTNSGNLLAWLLIFEHFVGASNTLRSAYIDQIRNAELVSGSLMTFIPTTLKSIYSSGNTAGIDRYAVDQYYIEFIEHAEDEVLEGLRAHVFYRALEAIPTLIRAWYEGCKDRQLTMTFMSAVTKFYSPALIKKEFDVLRQPGAISDLEDDNLTIKIVSGAPEVNAKYIIDEQPMEVSIRWPAEFPLKSVEVKDLGRVGVTENKWRGWIFNLQQMIMSRVGEAEYNEKYSWLNIAA
ncbi:hypothetical protein QFC22_000144 [Naganishia vaughanmartiniae]|uniref:Uncharacterized protein n=1 Tax=Naganishia vaughanmartiniae TaxID=1424756 RepID=A0ACC2XP88_9TREE|nr:hypothetical protein QFC22_000144 [Naganishia vaughanmartiniae]